MHDDLLGRQFTPTPNLLRLTDITEQRTAEGKIYFGRDQGRPRGQNVGYSIDSRMKHSLAVSALRSAITARRMFRCIWTI
jgi:putative transposase